MDINDQLRAFGVINDLTRLRGINGPIGTAAGFKNPTPIQTAQQKQKSARVKIRGIIDNYGK